MNRSQLTWLVVGTAAGLILGLSIAGVGPQTSVHAVATHGQDNFAIATGQVDEELEAIYFLDYLTGDLSAAILNLQTRRFNAEYKYNVVKDFTTQGTKNPRYLMVTGKASLRRGGAATQIAEGVIYVAEATSGQVVVYALPWIAGRAGNPTRLQGTFVPLDKYQFRTAAIRQVE